MPCDNSWMQKNWDKWQGYTFYTARSNIEKCLTVTFSMGVQPVVAFVGGVQLDLLPTPLVQLDTQICWPKHHPGGVDISVLRTEIRTAGILLFSRTMRLAKRFGDHTGFSGRNLNKGFETFRSQFGLDWARSKSESGSGFYKMKRTTPQLLQTNSSLKHDKVEEEAELQWVDAEDLYMASVEYGEHMSVNKTSELRGSAAHRRMSMMQSQSESGQSQSEPESYKLFGFKKPGKVNFDFQGLLTGNTLELQVKMGFGPFESPAQRIPLLNIVDQFSALLQALPFISKGSRGKAEEALSDFSREGCRQGGEACLSGGHRSGHHGRRLQQGLATIHQVARQWGCGEQSSGLQRSHARRMGVGTLHCGGLPAMARSLCTAATTTASCKWVLMLPRAVDITAPAFQTP